MVSAIFVIVFAVNYTVLPLIDHRYRAVFFPGDKLAAALTQRFHAATGKQLSYVIGSMWTDGGNLARIRQPDQLCQVLIDGLPARAPWIDLDDMGSRAKGAVVEACVWTERATPRNCRRNSPAIASVAEVGAPFDLPMRRGYGTLHVGWAIVKPQPAIPPP